MRSPLAQIVILTLGYALIKTALRYCEQASAKRKVAELQVHAWEDEGGKPASTVVS